MKAKHVVMKTGFSRSLIGLAMLAASFTAASQQQQQQQAEPEGQRQQDVRVAVAPGDAQRSAQQMTLNAVRVIRVKPDHIAEFEDLLKELGAALTQRGEAGFTVWQVAFGDQATYHIVSPMQSFASIPQMEANPPMEPERWARWIGRMQSTIDSQTLSVAQMHADLSIMPQEQAGTAAPELLILIQQTLLPGKREAFLGWLGNELLPALRKTNVLGVLSNEMAFGADGRQWVFAVPISSWAELDRPMPLFTTMGQQAAQELLDRGDAMVERSEMLVLRGRTDLSTPSASASPGEPAPQPAQ